MPYVSVEDLIDALLFEFREGVGHHSEKDFENLTVRLSDIIDSIVEFADDNAIVLEGSDLKDD